MPTAYFLNVQPILKNEIIDRVAATLEGDIKAMTKNKLAFVAVIFYEATDLRMKSQLLYVL